MWRGSTPRGGGSSLASSWAPASRFFSPAPGPPHHRPLFDEKILSVVDGFEGCQPYRLFPASSLLGRRRLDSPRGVVKKVLALRSTPFAESICTPRVSIGASCVFEVARPAYGWLAHPASGRPSRTTAAGISAPRPPSTVASAAKPITGGGWRGVGWSPVLSVDSAMDRPVMRGVGGRTEGSPRIPSSCVPPSVRHPLSTIHLLLAFRRCLGGGHGPVPQSFFSGVETVGRVVVWREWGVGG